MTNRLLAAGGILAAVGCGLWVFLSWGRPAAVPTDEKRGRTPLYQAFAPEKVTEKYAPRFMSDSSSGSSSGLEYVPLGELFRVSHFRGRITDDDLKIVLADLQTDFVALAQASGVKAADPKTTVGDRPIALLMPFSGEIDVPTLKGFYITYDGGAIDVFADKKGKDAKTEWRVVCMLHEKK